MFIARLVLTVCFLSGGLALPSAADLDCRVRASHPHIVRLLATGEQGSATFRDLLERLQASDVIVHVEAAAPGHGIDGSLQFVTASGSTRYLRVSIRLDLRTSELVALLGHELRHAVEVAERVDVRDELAFRRLYEEAGRPTRRGRRRVTYDTRAAIVAGQRVAIELRNGHAWQLPVAAR